jgi:hypothetical protein
VTEALLLLLLRETRRSAELLREIVEKCEDNIAMDYQGNFAGTGNSLRLARIVCTLLGSK